MNNVQKIEKHFDISNVFRYIRSICKDEQANFKDFEGKIRS